MLRELDEFEEALEIKADTVGEELADVALYLIMMLGDLDYPLLRGVRLTRIPIDALGTGGVGYPSVLTRPIRRRVCQAFEAWRRDDRPPRLFLLNIQAAFEALLDLAAYLGIDLEAECVLKMKKNADRRRLHGGKHPDT